MLILGHPGITLGAAVLLNGALTKGALPHPKESLDPSPNMRATRDYPSGRMASWLASLVNRIDIRVLLIGSLLPDIIDKPLGYLFFRETFSNVRLFSHTLLFLILITIAGFILYRYRRKTWLFVLSFGTFTHLLCDQMWRIPQTLFWPMYGFTFIKKDLTHWVERVGTYLVTDTAAYIPEIVGGVILILFLWVVVSNGKLRTFIRYGKLYDTASGR